MSMAFRTCPECRWNKVGHYCGKQMTLNGFECINFDKKEIKEVNKIIKGDDNNMKIVEKEYPTGKNAMCGDIIITNEDEYLLIGWDHRAQRAITIDVKKTTNNVRIYDDTDEIRAKYPNCRVIPAGEITMTFFE